MRLALAAVVTVAASSVLPLAPARASTCNVTVDFPNFAPSTFTIAPGGTVHWCWAGTSSHSVTSDSLGGFDSGVQSSGATFAHTFATAGTYAYHCSVHSSMTATVVVKAGATPSPPHTTTPPAPKPTTATPRPVTTTTSARTSPTPPRTSPPVMPSRTARPPTSPPARAVGTPALTASPAPSTTPLAGTSHRSGRTTALVVLGSGVLLGGGVLVGLRRRTAR